MNINPNTANVQDFIWNDDAKAYTNPHENSQSFHKMDFACSNVDLGIDEISTNINHVIKSESSGKVSIEVALPHNFKLSACLICTSNINSYVQALLPVSASGQGQDSHTQYPLEVGGNRKFVSSNEITESILHDFSKMFKISPTIYQSVDLSVLTSPLFCESCSRKMFESIGILREIERLERDLDRLKDEIREELLQSYCSSGSGQRFRGEDDDDKELSRACDSSASSTEESKNKQKIRKAFAQCWTKSSIPIRRISPTAKEDLVASSDSEITTRTRTRTSTRTSTRTETVVKTHLGKQEVRLENDIDLELSDLEDFAMEMVDGDTGDKSASDSDSVYCLSDEDVDSDAGEKAVTPSSKNKSPNRKARGRKRVRSRSNSASSFASVISTGNGNDDDDETLVSFQCEFCERTFYKESYKVDDGTGAGTNNPRYVFTCDLPRCKTTKPFKHFARFQRHHAGTCKSRPSYPCEHCERRCFSAKSLKEHTRAKHYGEPEPNPSNPSIYIKPTDRSALIRVQSFTCEFCERVFNRDDFRTENGDYLFTCDLPNCKTTKPFESLPKFKQHHKNNCLSRPGLPCEYCGKRCYDEKTLKHHIISHHTKEFEFTCDHCGMGLPTLGALKGHLMTHAEERIHKCPHCPKSFKKKYDLRVHAERHGERIVCEVCGKAFNCRRDLNNHKFIHASEKNFACKICNKFFKSRAYVDTHVWNVHKKARKPRQRPKPSDSNVLAGSGELLNDDTDNVNLYMSALNSSLSAPVPLPLPVDPQTMAMALWNQSQKVEISSRPC